MAFTLKVTIFGPTKELVEMHITDDVGVGGDKQPVKDVEKLPAIVDATFLRYDDLKKTTWRLNMQQSSGHPLLEKYPD